MLDGLVGRLCLLQDPAAESGDVGFILSRRPARQAVGRTVFDHQRERGDKIPRNQIVSDIEKQSQGDAGPGTRGLIGESQIVQL